MVEGEASKDFLTGLYTRESLYQQIQKLQLDYGRYQSPFSVLVIDIDHFKRYNDKYGHATGDEILKFFSNSIRASLAARQTFAFRVGGDEFVVLFPVDGLDEVESLANRMNENLRRMPCQVGERTIKLSFSAGISGYPMNGNTAEELLHRADQAMYFSKRTGRGRVMQYGHSPSVRFRRAVRLFALFAVALLLGTEIGLFIQSHVDIQDKIADAASKTQFYSSYLKGEIFRAAKPVRSLFDVPPPASHPNILPVSTNISTPSAVSSDAPRSIALSVITPPAMEWDLIYLKSGRIIQGIILAEDEDRLTLQLNISANRGVIVLDKHDIFKIIRKSASQHNI